MRVTLSGQARPVNERVVGNSRDHALLLCTFLRQQGRPARVRAGFARYLGVDMIHDHWITETWAAEEQRWVQIDPQIDDIQRKSLKLTFDPACGLVGVLYILDKPSIGLHARDQRNLLDTLLQLRDLGNTVLVVEHDAATMRAADWLVDLGPGAGILGGDLVAAGTQAEVAANPLSLTGRYLNGSLRVTAPNDQRRRTPRGWLTFSGARLFNLKNVTARFPLGTITCVTGVSGSGKSSLISETLYPALSRALMGAQSTPSPYDRLDGLNQLDKVIDIT